MTKKPLLVPYVKCNELREYITFHGYGIIGDTGDVCPYHNFDTFVALPLYWEEAKDFHAELKVSGTNKGRSAAQVHLTSRDGYTYTMFFHTFVDMVAHSHMHNGWVEGTFRHVKKGANYAIEKVKE